MNIPPNDPPAGLRHVPDEDLAGLPALIHPRQRSRISQKSFQGVILSQVRALITGWIVLERAGAFLVDGVKLDLRWANDFPDWLGALEQPKIIGNQIQSAAIFHLAP